MAGRPIRPYKTYHNIATKGVMSELGQYTLVVSYDCGSTYGPERTADDPAEFNERCDELDGVGLRWAIDDKHGQSAYRVCRIHESILGLLAHTNKSNELWREMKRQFSPDIHGWVIYNKTKKKLREE